MTIQARNHAEPNDAHPRAGMTKRKLVMEARARRRRRFLFATEPSGHQKDHPGRETRVIPCVVVGAHSRTRVCVFIFDDASKNIRTHRSNFVCFNELIVIHD